MSVGKGTLILNVLEASGVNKEGAYVWDQNTFNAWVKVELRGGPTNVKVQTQPVAVSGQALIWKQALTLDVADGAKELRLMLCKERLSEEGRRGVSVVAACGIFVEQILENVPIDKYFELFKPNGGGDGGFIRIGIDFKPATIPSEPVGRTPTIAETATPAVEASTKAAEVKTKAADSGAAAEGSAPESSTEKSPSSLERSSPLDLAVPIVLAVIGIVGLVLVGKRSNKKRN